MVPLPLNIPTPLFFIFIKSNPASGTRVVGNTSGRECYGTTNMGYGTTNADAGVGIGLKGGLQKFDPKRLLNSQ